MAKRKSTSKYYFSVKESIKTRKISDGYKKD